MTIAQYLRLLREQWIAVLLLTVLGAVGAGTFSLLQTPMYEANAQLFVSTVGSGSLGEMAQGSTFTQQRVKSYTNLLTSPQVLEPVIDTLSLGTTAGELGGRVTATSPLDTVLINVTVTDDSPTRAADIANAVAVQFPTLVNKLETRPGTTYSPVTVRVTRTAVAPSGPVSPRTALNLALGLLVGLGLGVGTAVLRDSLDRTIGGRTQAGELAGAPVLGAVADDSQVPNNPLIGHDAFSPRAEAFRQMRTNIRFLSVDHRVASFVVTGSVQGEGKTTTAANLAIALAQSGERVVLVDADLRRPAVADLFGVPSGIGLTTVLLGDTGVDAALQRWRDDLPLFLLPAGPLPPNPSELIGSDRMAELVHHLTGHGMTVVVDSPPLLPVTDAAILARVTDGALLVTRVASTKTDQFTGAVESLRAAGAPVLGVILNRVPKRGRASGTYGGYHVGYGAYAPDKPVTRAAAPAKPLPAAALPAAAMPAPLANGSRGARQGLAPGGEHFPLRPQQPRPQQPRPQAPAPQAPLPAGSLPPGSLDAVLRGTPAPTLLSPVADRAPEVLDLRHQGASPMTAPFPEPLHASGNDGPPAQHALNGARNGAASHPVNGGLNGVMNGAGPGGAGPNGVAYNGSAPGSSAPNGAAYNGSTPNGAAYNGTTPNGAAYNGTTPNGAAYNGSTPNGAAYNGSTPDGSTSDGVSYDGSAPGGPGETPGEGGWNGRPSPYLGTDPSPSNRSHGRRSAPPPEES